MTLPEHVIEEDQRLQRANEDLHRLRWHWTLDESNPDRVGFREYARQVGVDPKTVMASAKGWGNYREAAAGPRPLTRSLYDEIQLATLGDERRQATEDLAEALGTSAGNVHKNLTSERDGVLNQAREAAERRGTDVSHEITRKADFAAQVKKGKENRHKEQSTDAHVVYEEIEGHLGYVVMRLRSAVKVARDADAELDREMVDVLEGLLESVRGYVALCDAAISGSSGVDWDAELAKLGGAA